MNAVMVVLPMPAGVRRSANTARTGAWATSDRLDGNRPTTRCYNRRNVTPVCNKSYWDHVAPSFSVLGPPLKPSPEDVQFVETAVANWCSSHPGKRLRALLLGVTAEIATMRWPEESSLIAVG